MSSGGGIMVGRPIGRHRDDTRGPIDAVAGVNSKTAAQLLDLLARSVSETADRLADCLRRCDWAAARALAHGLKGTAWNGNLWDLAELVDKIDAQLRSETPETAGRLVDALERAAEGADLSIKRARIPER